jgi:hypothetical protein
MIACLATLALLAQDPIAAEAKFRALLEKAERIGLVVPDLPDAAAELESLSRASKDSLPKELKDRYAVVRSQAAVTKSLHGRLGQKKGAAIEMPGPGGKPAVVSVVEVTKTGVRVSRPEGIQEYKFGELDPEWALSMARGGFAAETDAPLLGGLWLAKAARWETAYLAFGDLQTDHPLAAEARNRGVDAVVMSLDALAKGRRWSDALLRLAAAEKLAPDDKKLESARERILEAMVEHGKELCRKKSKGPMQEVIDLIAKHFPDGASRIEDVREAVRWIKVTDPKRFLPEGVVKGAPPWLLDAGDESAKTAHSAESAESYVGLSIRIRFDKGSAAQGGMIWENGNRLVWIAAKTGNLCAAEGKPGQFVTSYLDKKIDMAGPHTIVVRIRDGHYVVTYNGEEFDRVETKKTKLEGWGLNSAISKTWFDEVYLLKKE